VGLTVNAPLSGKTPQRKGTLAASQCDADRRLVVDNVDGLHTSASELWRHAVGPEVLALTLDYFFTARRRRSTS